MSTITTTVNVVRAFSSQNPQAKHNEDRYGLTTASDGSVAAWVIDGATGYKPQERLVQAYATDAEWYAQTLNRIFHRNIQAGSPDSNNAAVYRDSIVEIAEAFEQERAPKYKRVDIERAMQPSAADLVMNFNSQTGKLHFKGLGDCIALVQFGEFHEPIVTTPSFQEESKIREELMRTGQYTNENRLARRNKMNTSEGYWIMSLEPEAADHMIDEEIDIPEGGTTHVVLMSDGLERGLKLMRFSPYEMMEVIRHEGIDELARNIRMMEKRLSPDVLKKEHGYSKQYDDITGVHLAITREIA